MSKLYPSLTPAADYRLDQVRAFQRELSAEVEKRHRLLEKNKRWRHILARSSETLSVCTLGLGSTSVGLLATGIGLPAAIPTAALGAAVGLIDLTLSPAQRRLEKKGRRHSQLATLAESKLLTISRLLSKALADGSLSDSEFQAFGDEKESWLSARNTITRSAEAELRKLAAEIKARLAQIDKNKHTGSLSIV